MDKFNPLKVILVVLVLLISHETRAQERPLNDNPLNAKLSSLVRQAAANYLKDTTSKEIIIGIINQGQRHYYHYARAYKGSRPFAQQPLYYNIGSVAKTFVATALAQAVIEKRLDLNEDIRKYLPQNYPNLQYNGFPIKLIDLANHTSGLPGIFHHYPQNTIDALMRKSLTQQAAFFASNTQDTLLADLHELRPDTIPGAKFRYNSSAYMLLTLILERVYGKPYQEIITSYLRDKLCLFNIKPLLNAAELQNTAQGHDSGGKAVEYINLEGYFIGPSINATLFDLVGFIDAQLAEHDPAIILTHQLSFKKPDGSGLGLGWMMGSENGQSYLYHDGNTKLGFNTLCTYYPKLKLGIVIIVNEVSDQRRVGQLENKIRELIN
jgi:CubicO group peptidase (beta-lactamase class C family)